MSQPSPAPASAGGTIVINGRIEGKNFAIGPYARVDVVEQHFHAEIGDERLRQMVRSMLQEGRTQLDRLALLGVSSGVAPLTLGVETLSPPDPFASPISIPPLPPFVQRQDLERTDQAFVAVNQLLEQIDHQIQGGQVQEVIAEGQSLNLVALLLQQGNLALWRFRQGALPLFTEQASLYALAQPQHSPLLAFQVAARGDREVLRGWVLYLRYQERQPAFIDQPTREALSQGRWQTVLHDWVVQHRLSGEQAQAEHQYLSAIGEPYNAQTVQTAAREAEWYFSAALKRQPDQSVALVNLGALLAESALLSYIETGKADRTRLNQARKLLQQAQALLEQRPDRDGQLALAQCLLYEATSLPPDAQFDTVKWAVTQVQHMRTSLRQEVPTTLRLDMVQRNLARYDSSFLDRQKIERARDLLTGIGAVAGMVALAENMLRTPAQMTDLMRPGIETGAAHHPSLSQPVDGTPGTATHPHLSSSATHSEPQPSGGLASHTLARANKTVGPHLVSRLVSTAAGKALIVGVAAILVLGGSLVGVTAAGKGPFASQSNNALITSPTADSALPTTAPTLPDVPTTDSTTPTVTAGPSGPAGAVTEFPLTGPLSNANGITVGPDKNLWFTADGQIESMTPQGSITTFPVPNDASGLGGIVTGPDGNLWFMENYQIGRITPSGTVTEFPLPPQDQGGGDITAGPDGNLWFTTSSGIGSITPAGAITGFPVPVPDTYGALIKSITAGSDGNLWFTEGDVGPYGSPEINEIGRITPSGTITKFLLPNGLVDPEAITLGLDGDVWFTADKDNGPNADASGWIGRITPNGAFSGFPVPKDTGGLSGITAGPDGNLWFTESRDDWVGRLTPTGVITEFTLPSGLKGTPGAIISGPGGVWFTVQFGEIGYISTGT